MDFITSWVFTFLQSRAHISRKAEIINIMMCQVNAIIKIYHNLVVVDLAVTQIISH